jgi:hypothetical protein
MKTRGGNPLLCDRVSRSLASLLGAFRRLGGSLTDAFLELIRLIQLGGSCGCMYYFTWIISSYVCVGDRGTEPAFPLFVYLFICLFGDHLL